MGIDIDDIFDGAKNLYNIKQESDKRKYEEEFFKLIFKKLKNKEVYIDSNIFITTMNKGVDRFFSEFSNYPDIKIIMPKEQYEEIYNLKNNTEKPNSEVGARSAFRIIEKLFNSNNLNILDLEKECDKKAYADPIFIEKIIENLKDEKNVYFLTEDKDLQIRLKSKIKSENLNEDNITISSFLNIYADKKNLVNEERKRIKEIEENNKVIDEILNPGLGRRMLDKVLDSMTPKDCR